jgi:hypothetical protein
MVPLTGRTTLGAPSPKAFARSSPNLLQEESGMPRSKRGSQPREKRRGVDDAFKKVRGARERHCHQPANECQLSPAPPRTPQGTHHQSRQPVTFTSVRRPQRHHALRGRPGQRPNHEKQHLWRPTRTQQSLVASTATWSTPHAPQQGPKVVAPARTKLRTSSPAQPHGRRGHHQANSPTQLETVNAPTKTSGAAAHTGSARGRGGFSAGEDDGYHPRGWQEWVANDLCRPRGGNVDATKEHNISTYRFKVEVRECNTVARVNGLLYYLVKFVYIYNRKRN